MTKLPFSQYKHAGTLRSGRGSADGGSTERVGRGDCEGCIGTGHDNN